MRFIAILGLLSACEPMPPSGNPLAPAVVKKPAPAAPESSDGGAEAPPEANATFDFDADEGKGEPEPEVIDDPIALLAAQQGVELPPAPPPSTPPPAPSSSEPAAPAPTAPAPVTAMAPISWSPDSAAPVDWGVRLVSTLNDTSPPRAVIGLPDGTETVVTAGDFLQSQRIVVMAVGDKVVEVAHISNAGYQAKVETRMIQALFE